MEERFEKIDNAYGVESNRYDKRDDSSHHQMRPGALANKNKLGS